MSLCQCLTTAGQPCKKKAVGPDTSNPQFCQWHLKCSPEKTQKFVKQEQRTLIKTPKPVPQKQKPEHNSTLKKIAETLSILIHYSVYNLFDGDFDPVAYIEDDEIRTIIPLANLLNIKLTDNKEENVKALTNAFHKFTHDNQFKLPSLTIIRINPWGSIDLELSIFKTLTTYDQIIDNLRRFSVAEVDHPDLLIKSLNVTKDNKLSVKTSH